MTKLLFLLVLGCADGLRFSIKEFKKEQPADNLPGSKLPPILFVKNHKVGGSTMANILHRLGDSRNMTFMLPNDNMNFGWPHAFPGEYKEPAHQYDIICNHAVYNKAKMKQYLAVGLAPAFKFTLVREPISHLQSSFNFFQTRVQKAGYTDLEKYFKGLNHTKQGASIVEKHLAIELSKDSEDTSKLWPRRIDFLKSLFAEPDQFDYRLVAHFRNPQAHNMGYYEFFSKQHPSESQVDKWIEGLDFDYVMLTEKYNEGLVLLQKRLGLTDLKEMSTVHFKNRKATDQYRVASPAETDLDELRKVLAVDFALYDRFKAKFEQEWQAEGDEGKVEELKKLNEHMEEACENWRQNKAECPWTMRADNVRYTKYLRTKQHEDQDLKVWLKKQKPRLSKHMK